MRANMRVEFVIGLGHCPGQDFGTVIFIKGLLAENFACHPDVGEEIGPILRIGYVVE